MNDHDSRITQLEAENTELRRRLSRVESEHRSLLQTFERAAAERERLRAETEGDYQLAMTYVDERIADLAAREPSASGPALGSALAHAVHGRVTELLACDGLDGLDVGSAHLVVASLRLVERVSAELASGGR